VSIYRYINRKKNGVGVILGLEIKGYDYLIMPTTVRKDVDQDYRSYKQSRESKKNDLLRQACSFKYGRE